MWDGEQTALFFALVFALTSYRRQSKAEGGGGRREGEGDLKLK